MSETFYAVAVGRVPGVYGTWADAEKQVLGFAGASHKKFANEADAMAFVGSSSKTTLLLVANKDGKGGWNVSAGSEFKSPFHCPGATVGHALLWALDAALRITQGDIEIVTGNWFAYNCLTRYFASWSARGWRNARGVDIAFKEMYASIVSRLSKRSYRVTFRSDSK